MNPVFTIELNNGSTLEVEYTDALKSQIRNLYNIDTSLEITQEQIKTFIMNELFSAIKNAENAV